MEASILLNVIGTAAFVAGILFLTAELLRKGLSRLSLISYLCFLTSTVLLSGSVLMLAVSAGGLTALFLVLLIFYRKEQRQLARNQSEDREEDP